MVLQFLIRGTFIGELVKYELLEMHKHREGKKLQPIDTINAFVVSLIGE